MKALIQRVKQASVTIDEELYSSIKSGMLIFLGVEKTDEGVNVSNCCDNTSPLARKGVNVEKLVEKLINLRIFEDSEGKMNKSILDVKGEILVVSQFTLAGDCKKGTRPSFDKAAPPDKANELYEYFVEKISQYGLTVKTGKFQAMMDVSLINDGPVTFMVEK